MQKYWSIFIKVIAGFVVVLSISVLGLLWRLNHSPVSLNFLLKPWVKQYYPEDVLKIENIDLIWQGWKNPFVVQAHNIVFEKPEEILVTVPLLELTFKFSGLYKKKFLPTFINGVNPVVILKNKTTFNFPHTTGDNNDNPLRKLKQFQITGAAVKGENIVIENGDFFGIYENKNIKGIVKFKILKDTHTLPLKVDFFYKQDQKRLSANILWNEQDIHPWLYCFSDVEIKAPFKGKITADWDFNTSFFPVSIQGEAEGLKGEIKGAFLEKPVAFQSFKTHVAIEEDQLVLKNLHIQSNDSVLIGEGRVDLPEILVFKKTVENVQHRQFSFKLNATALPWDLLTAGWPLNKLESVRTWIHDHISTGVIDTISVQGKGEILPHCPVEIDWEFLKGDATLRDTILTYNTQMPPLEQMKGKIFFNTEELDLQLQSCQYQGLRVHDSRFTLKSFSQSLPIATLDIKFQGNLADFLKILQAPGVQFFKELPCDIKETTGDIQGNLGLSFPVKSQLVASDFKPTFTATIKEANTVLKIIPDYPLALKQNDLSCKFSPPLLEIKGKGKVQGALTSYILRKGNTSIDLEILSQISVDEIAKVWPVAIEYSKGLIDLKVIYKKNLNQKNIFEFFEGDADLKQATVTLDALNWQKEKNIPLSMHFKIMPSVEDFNFTVNAVGAAAQVTGKGTWNKQVNKISHLDFPIVHLGDNQFSCVFDTNNVKIKGREVDISKIFHQHKETSFNDIEEFKAVVDLDTLIINPRQLLKHLTFRADWKGGNLSALLLKGQIQEKKHLSPLEIHLHTSAKERVFSLTTSNGGGFFNLLDMTDTIKGGHLKITGQQPWRANISSKHPFQCLLLLNDFHIINAGFFTRLFSLAMVVGVFDLVRGQGIAFNEAKIRFNILDNAIKIEKAHATGVSLGITAEGTINTKQNNISLEGTLIPAYLINAALSHIPLVGQLLSGGRKGIFATSFHVKGELKNPKIEANPLSTLAPGFIQEIFSHKAEGDSTEKHN